MPIIKSAIKRLRQSETRRLRNLARRNKLKNTLKEFKKLVKEGNLKEAESKLPTVFKIIDKSAKHNIIHANNAARKKSWCAKVLAAPAK